jgi:hypothetical protein
LACAGTGEETKLRIEALTELEGLSEAVQPVVRIIDFVAPAVPIPGRCTSARQNAPCANQQVLVTHESGGPPDGVEAGEGVLRDAIGAAIRDDRADAEFAREVKGDAAGEQVRPWDTADVARLHAKQADVPAACPAVELDAGVDGDELAVI